MERFINILIIDSDPKVRMELKEILSGGGNNILLAKSIPEALPIIKQKDSAGKIEATIELIAGSLKNEKAPIPPPNSWANNSSNSVGIFNLKLEPGAKFELPGTRAGVNRTIYYYSGNGLTIEDHSIPNYQLAEVNSTKTIA